MFNVDVSLNTRLICIVGGEEVHGKQHSENDFFLRMYPKLARINQIIIAIFSFSLFLKLLLAFKDESLTFSSTFLWTDHKQLKSPKLGNQSSFLLLLFFFLFCFVCLFFFF